MNVRANEVEEDDTPTPLDRHMFAAFHLVLTEPDEDLIEDEYRLFFQGREVYHARTVEEIRKGARAFHEGQQARALRVEVARLWATIILQAQRED